MTDPSPDRGSGRPFRPTVADGRESLRAHVIEKAWRARAAYGPNIDASVIQSMLSDREVVRYPTQLRFDAGALVDGEFAHAEQVGSHPSQGYLLFVHPRFERSPHLWPALIAYHLPPINYGDIVQPEDCEAFGAALLGIERDAYYELLCELADSISCSGD